MTDERILEDRPAPVPKEDPESLVLRGRPRPVVRFRRGLIIGLTAAVSAGVVAVTWVALEPKGLRLAGSAEERGEAAERPTPEALAGAPGSYGDVPQLGEPLPGDLGRPILDHQRSLARSRLAASSQAEQGSAAGSGPGSAQDRGAASRVALASPVLVQLASRPERGAVAERKTAEAREPVEPAPAAPEMANSAIPVSQQRKIAFAASPPGWLNPHVLEAAPSPYMLAAGTVIPLSLVTGLDSDLPGTVLAQVTQNVFDSATGRILLIPQGARLVGAYDSVVAYGQRRALLAWKRLILPDGASLELDNMPAADTTGFAGISDKVDAHGWRLLKGMVLSTLLGVGTQVSLGSDGDLVRAVREAAQQNASRAGDQITMRNLDVQPTIRVRPGFRLLAVINKDLVLRPWRQGVDD